MYERILVPLDGSQRAEAILPHVETLAQRPGCQVFLLHVVDPTTTMVGLDGLPVDVTRDLINEQAEGAQTYLQQKQAALQVGGAEITLSVRYGAIVQTIIEAAADYDADLIALASHGRTGLARMFYGSVAAGVLHRVDRPLLIIRATDQPE